MVSPTVIILLLVGAFIFLRGGTASASTNLPSTAGVNPNASNATTNGLLSILGNAVNGLKTGLANATAPKPSGGSSGGGSGGGPSGGGSGGGFGGGGGSLSQDEIDANSAASDQAFQDVAEGDASIAATDTGNVDSSTLGDLSGELQTAPPPLDMSGWASVDPSGADDGSSAADDSEFASSTYDDTSSYDYSGGDSSSYDDSGGSDFSDY